MKIINAGYEVINDSDFKNPLQKIERIARVCYKSEDLITEDSYKKMTQNLVSRNHLAMLEHATLAYFVDETLYGELEACLELITKCTRKDDAKIEPMSRIHLTRNDKCTRFIVSGNIRAWVEFFRLAVGIGTDKLLPLYYVVNDAIDNIMNYPYYSVIVIPKSDTIVPITDWSKLEYEEMLVHRTFSVLFTVDRGVTHELVRMRDCSFAQESTRYCNYSKGKFGNEITVIKPCFFEEGSQLYEEWKTAVKHAEMTYNNMIAAGAKPQEARSILPNSTKSDIVMTANAHEWRHIFNLRACDATGPAHPQMKEVMIPLFLEMRVKYPDMFGDLSLRRDS